MSLRIIGLGKGIPVKQVSNDDLAKFLDTSDEWIFSRTGIKSRHISTNETLTDLSAEAARQAMRNAGLSPPDIGMIIASTINGDFRTPSLSCCVAGRVGAKCPAFDINAACTGFIYALETASCFLEAGKAENILIICAEMMSSLVDWSDRSTCVLFGDGAAACVVTKGSALKYIHLWANGDTSMLNLPVGSGGSPFAEHPRETGCLRMNGQDVYRFAVNAVETEINRALAELGITADDIDFFVLHQANRRIIDSAKAKLRFSDEKFPVNIDRYGNLSSVSIPLLLCEMAEEGKLKRGDTLFMCAFGAGLTAGGCVMEWQPL